MTEESVAAAPKARFCSGCGATNQATASFCRSCGKPIKARAAAAVEPAVEVTPAAPGVPTPEGEAAASGAEGPPRPEEPATREAEAADAGALCPQCGAPRRPGAKFCRGCGAPANDEAAADPTPTAADASPEEAEIPLFVAPVWATRPRRPGGFTLGSKEVAILVGGSVLTLAVAAAVALVIWNGGVDFSTRPYQLGAHDHVSANVAWAAPNESYEALKSCNDETCFTAGMKKFGASRPAVRFARRIQDFFDHGAFGYAQKVTHLGKVDLVEVFLPGFGMEGTLEYLIANGPSGLVNASDYRMYEAINLNQDATYRNIRARHPNVMLWPQIGFSHAEQTSGGGQTLVFDLTLLDGCHACAVLGVAHFGQGVDGQGRYTGLSLIGISPEAEAAPEVAPPAPPPAVPEPSPADPSSGSPGVAPTGQGGGSPPMKRADDGASARLVRETLQAARSCLGQENYDCAEANAQTVLRIEPGESHAVTMLADIRRKRQEALQSNWNAR